MSVEAAAILESLIRCQFLTREQLSEIVRNCYNGTFPSIADLRHFFSERDWLTPFQLDKIISGKPDEIQLGRFLIQQRLGEGGFGEVFRAVEMDGLRRNVVLKLLRSDVTKDQATLEQFLNEMVLLGRLKSRYFPRTHNADRIGDVWVIVLEYVDGTDLRSLVEERGKLPWPDVREIGLQTASALDYIHRLNMTHRAIKPANIVFDYTKRRVYLLDFGIGRLEEMFPGTADEAPQGTAPRTLEFMAPELRNGKGDIRGDLFGLGATLFYTVTGRIPTYPLLSARGFCPEVPADFDTLLAELTADDPAHRPQTPQEVITALQAIPSP